MGKSGPKHALSGIYIGQFHLLAIVNARNSGLAEANVRIVTDAIGQETYFCHQGARNGDK